MSKKIITHYGGGGSNGKRVALVQHGKAYVPNRCVQDKGAEVGTSLRFGSKTTQDGVRQESKEGLAGGPQNTKV